MDAPRQLTTMDSALAVAMAKAEFYGYDCASCGIHVQGMNQPERKGMLQYRTPVRAGNSTVFYCCFPCARKGPMIAQ